MPSRSPTLSEVFQTAIDSALDSVHTAIPAKVTRYNASKQQADVQPLIKQAYEDEFGDRQVASLPVVTNCPVQFPGGGGFTLIYPLSEGDTGLLVFSQASIDKWLSTGGTVDPDIDHRHALTDGIFIPGVNPFSSPRSDGPSDKMIVGRDNNSVQIQIGPFAIKLGQNATDAVIKGTAFNTTVASPLVVATGIMGTATGTASGAVGSATTVPQLVSALGPWLTAFSTYLTAITTLFGTAFPLTLSTITKTQ